MLLNKNVEQQTAFQVAALNGQTEVLQKLWESVKENLTPEELKNTLLLAEESSHKSVFHIAEDGGNREVLRKLWDWGKQELTPDESKDTIY